METIKTAEQSGQEQAEAQKERENAALLNQCAAHSKAALDSFSELLPMVTDEGLHRLILQYRPLYENCAEGCRRFLKMGGSETHAAPKKSWLSTQVKLAFRSDSATIAALLFDGCHRMIRDLYTSLHQWQNADGESRRIAYRLIGTSEDFRDELKDFL